MIRHKLFQIVVAVLALLLATAAPLWAVTPAGVLITNQATATYLDTETEVAGRALSNIALVKVANLYALSLQTDQNLNVAAGQWVNFQHVLTNTGNTADVYDLAFTNHAGDDFDFELATLVEDINQNGLVDAGEPAITTTSLVMPGDSVHLVLAGRVPGMYIPGQVGVISVFAISQADPTITQTNTDTATLASNEAVFQFSKTSEPKCEEEVGPGQEIQYAITLTNVGGAAPNFRTIVVDGALKTGLLVEDPLPSNVTLAIDIVPQAAPVGSLQLAKLPGSAVSEWISFANVVEGDLVERVGVLYPDVALGSNESASWEFSVRVIDQITPGTKIVNQAEIDLEGDGFPDLYSNEVCNSLKPATVDDPVTLNDAIIRFLEPVDALRVTQTPPDFTDDDDYQDAGVYRLSSYPTYNDVRDGVYLEVRSSSLNSSPVAADIIVVYLVSKLTGDDIYVQLEETGPNTGIFRSRAPITLDTNQTSGGGNCSASNPGGCTLKSISRDTLQASIQDPGTGFVLVDAATVDPLGVVFDSVTLDPIAGALVSIRTPDGQLALDPDTGGATVLEPQLTANDGAYQFPRVYPGTYYILVQPPEGYNFPSVTPAHTFSGQYLVGAYSYGQNGHQKTPNAGQFTLAAGDPALIVDIPLDPDNNGRFVLEKSTTDAIVQVGDFVPYTLRVRNNAGAKLFHTKVRDQLPYGFKYVRGSVKVDGEKTDDPSGEKGPVLIFSIDTMDDGQTVEITYVLMVTPGALDSDGINRATAYTKSGRGVSFTSATVQAQVDIEQQGLFSDRAILFGTVFVDANDNKVKDEEELAVGGVRIFLEDGTWVITDEKGQYSLYGLKPGMHVVKPDPITLPQGMELSAIDNRFGHDPGSRFADLVDGDFHRADFAFIPPEQGAEAIYESIKVRNEALDDSWVYDAAIEYDGILFDDSEYEKDHTPASTDGDISSGVAYPADKALPDPVAGAPTTVVTEEAEQLLKAMPPVEDTARQATAQQAREGVFVWPQGVVARDGRFMVIVPKGVQPVLSVNGEEVPANKMGEQVLNTTTGAQVLAWYGVPLTPGSCDVTVSGKDMFGNLRTLAQKTFVHPGPPTGLRIVPKQKSVPADGGRSALPVEIQINDKDGIGVLGVHFVTVETSDGRFLEPDIQDKEPGHQVRVENGRATLHVQSSFRSGKVDLAATAGTTLKDKTEINFSAPLRPIVAAGLVDFSVHFNEISEESILPTDQSDSFDEELDYRGRGAIFLKGKIKGNVLLTLAYDSDKDENEKLLRDIDPEAYYPIYGDASVKGYDAQSRSKLYVRLEKGKSSVMWGDYRTDYNEKSLARVDRTLTGANANIEVGGTKVSGFYAEPDYDRRTEEIRGNGTATFYRISGAPIEENSETIEIITRSRENPGLIINTQAMTRLDDYQIDPVSGYITFHEPIASVDKDNNPLYIRISYDTEGGKERHAIWGARAEQQITENLAVGGTHTQDEHPEDGSRISSGYVKYKLKDKHDVEAEFAHMVHKNGDPAGDATRVEMENRWHEKFSTKAKYMAAQPGFDNSSGSGSAGRQELTAEAEYKPYTHTTITVEGLESKDLQGEDERISAGLLGERKFGLWRTEAGGRLIRQMETADKEEEDIYTYRLGLGRDFYLLERKGQAGVSWEQDISNSSRRSLEANADWQVHKMVQLYAKQELINSLSGITSLSEDADRSTTTFGVSSDFMTNTKAYSEYRIRGGSSGREQESATGVRRTIDLQPGLSFSPQLEYVNTLDGENAGDAFSASMGMVDKRSRRSKKSGRVETRLGKESNMYGVRAAWAARLSNHWTGVVKEEFNIELPNESPDVLRQALTLGIARRPISTNQYHWIGVYQWKESRNADSVESKRAHILSSHHNYQALENLILSGRLAGKWQRVVLFGDYYESFTTLGGARIIIDITEWLDFDIHGGAMNTNGDSTRYSGGAAIFFNAFKNTRLGVGYNFAGFTDDDLDPERYYAEGLFLGLSYKFDESLFEWLGPDED
ncbi:MAG: DUF11 domain-containing protein [Desulfatibacillum sp.]|nr:DUF11 domain-containing protein [Desulfatibacillum sp.]